MNNEIKEKIKAYYIANDIDEILCYITNLQAIEQQYSALLSENVELENENERLKEELEEETLNKEIAQGHRKQLQDIELQERKEKNDYKSRCEKAIEYNKQKLQDIKEEIITLTIYDKKYEKYVKEILDNNLNILQGIDKE